MGPLWPPNINSEGSWDAPKNSKDEKQNLQIQCRIYLKNRHGSNFGRSQGHPWSQKKSWRTPLDGPTDPKERVTPLKTLHGAPPLKPHSEKTSILKIIKIPHKYVYLVNMHTPWGRRSGFPDPPLEPPSAMPFRWGPPRAVPKSILERSGSPWDSPEGP